ncbi:MAG TPA: hypothetical protein DCE41_28330 [Cytophagales bacterium]|nr:hypothetical protein [Cytophagales bacterium]HAA18421.1 hypothetical protein [Cytophagales bacterium]HAP61468.1 hypothetical protein [Cytophagales bacterium]
MKKLILSSLVVLLATSLSYAQWDQTNPSTNDNISRNGSIAVAKNGTTESLRIGKWYNNPTSLYGASTSPFAIATDGSSSTQYLQLFAGGSAVLDLQLADGKIILGSNATSPATRIAQTGDSWTGGRLGIGTSAVDQSVYLHVNGRTRLANTTNGGGMWIDGTNGEKKYFIGNSPGNNFRIYADGQNRLVVSDNGQVGINTSNPDPNFALSVNGAIRAKEIKCETGWADFVFEEDYELPTLEEVKLFIAENGHLKDIPSAEEVEANGIALAEMNARLLQKVEELTLYTIDQQEQLKQQSDMLNQQQVMINTLLETVTALQSEE